MRGSRPPKKPRAIAAEGSTLARAPPLLRVCSYNVLAQTHLETHSHLYRGAPPDALDGPTRLARLISQLAGLGADVLALQEVEPPVFAALSQALGAYGVRGVYKQRTGAGQPDGVAVFLRTPRLQLLCVEEVEFAALAKREPDLVVPPPSAELALRLRRQADKGQVALLVTVLDTQSGARLVVGCTHILFNPSRGAVKLGQVRELVTRAQRGAAAAGAGVVICGDFNCSPTSLLRSYLGGSPVDAPLSEEELWDGSASLKWGGGARRGRGRAAGRGGGGRHRGGAPADAPRVVAAPHPLADRLRSAYLAAGGREPDATTCHADACGTVDYIMYDARALSPRTLLPTPSLREVLAEGARWPSRQRPSDHVPIACDLEVLVAGGRGGE